MAERDASPVAKLRAAGEATLHLERLSLLYLHYSMLSCTAACRAGAIIVGKGNMHEWGAGVTGINLHHGSARNPYNTR